MCVGVGEGRWQEAGGPHSMMFSSHPGWNPRLYPPPSPHTNTFTHMGTHTLTHLLQWRHSVAPLVGLGAHLTLHMALLINPSLQAGAVRIALRARAAARLIHGAGLFFLKANPVCAHMCVHASGCVCRCMCQGMCWHGCLLP